MDAWRTSDLDAVILCGGRGRRLQSVVRDRPKPLAIVQGRPFLDYVIDHAARFGVRRFILAAGFQSGLIQDYCRNRPDRARFQVVEEPHPLGTGGAVKFAEPFLQSDVFLILNGDSFCPLDLNAFLGFHLQKNAGVSLALTRVDDSRDYGSVVLDEQQAVLGFREKNAAPGPGLVNAGVYVFHRDVARRIEPGTKTSLEHDVFPTLVRRGLYGFITDSGLLDIGTPERLDYARSHWITP